MWYAAGLALLVLAVLATRLPSMTQALYAFDSANYALAVRDYYNVAHHRPHPPGYPLYVFFGWVINSVVQDANRALIIEGILWSVVAVVCTALLARALFGPIHSLLASLLLVFTVGFWGYGEVAYPYVALAGETAALAWLAYLTIAGRSAAIVPLGLVWAIAAGVRWDGAVFCLPLWVWALTSVSWRARLASVAAAAVVIVAWAVPMVQLTGGWDVYQTALSDYLKVWSPQSAFIGLLGDFDRGGETLAGFNLNFLVNYLRQMLGIGILLILYLVGRRFGPAALATDMRSRFMLLWTLPPLLTYVFGHLGEPGYVLSLAPQAAILVALACQDLGQETRVLVDALRARWSWQWMPPARHVGHAVTAMLVIGILAWNVQAFVRGVGPGRLPDLRAHDATVQAQVAFLAQQPADRTVVLAHDIVRQLEYYLPGRPVTLQYSEYVPDWQSVRSRLDLPPGAEQVVVLDSGLRLPEADAARAREVVLSEQPPVSVWVIDVRGASGLEYGYRYLRIV